MPTLWSGHIFLCHLIVIQFWNKIQKVSYEYIASNLYGVHLKFMIIRVNSVIGSTLDGWTCKRKSTTVVYMETSEMCNNFKRRDDVNVRETKSQSSTQWIPTPCSELWIAPMYGPLDLFKWKSYYINTRPRYAHTKDIIQRVLYYKTLLK